jgi:hypothetical protein
VRILPLVLKLTGKILYSFHTPSLQSSRFSSLTPLSSTSRSIFLFFQSLFRTSHVSSAMDPFDLIPFRIPKSVPVCQHSPLHHYPRSHLLARLGCVRHRQFKLFLRCSAGISLLQHAFCARQLLVKVAARQVGKVERKT